MISLRNTYQHIYIYIYIYALFDIINTLKKLSYVTHIMPQTIMIISLIINMNPRNGFIFNMSNHEVTRNIMK